MNKWIIEDWAFDVEVIDGDAKDKYKIEIPCPCHCLQFCLTAVPINRDKNGRY